jgi:hypothetical protein
MENGRLKISKDLKMMQNLQLKNYFKVIFCDTRQVSRENFKEIKNWK